MLHNLISEIAVRKIKKKDIAKALDIDEKTLRLKLDGARQFKANEMLKIKDTFFPELTLDYLFEIDNKESA